MTASLHIKINHSYREKTTTKEKTKKQINRVLHF